MMQIKLRIDRPDLAFAHLSADDRSTVQPVYNMNAGKIIYPEILGG